MFKSKKKIFAVLLVTMLLISVFSAGCTPQQRPEPTPAPGAPGAPGTPVPGDPNQPGLDPRTGPQTDTNGRSEILADRIAETIPEVEAASVVSFEQTVYVAIQLEESISQSRSETLETQIAEMVMEEESNVERVYVSMEPETFNRLQGVAEGVEDGRPVSGFLEEVEEMFLRITPTRR